jgi:hypothetical protein
MDIPVELLRAGAKFRFKLMDCADDIECELYLQYFDFARISFAFGGRSFKRQQAL